MALTLPDTPSDRVLNVFQSVEGLLIKYIDTNPDDKEVARKILGNVRKCLAKDFDGLPMPKQPKVEKVMINTAAYMGRMW